MSDLFLKVLNMSISASWLIVVVLAFRIIFTKAPKQIRMLLWAIVAIRLICPISLESVLSLVPSAETVSPEIMTNPEPVIHSGVTVIDNTVNPVLSQSFAPEPSVSVNPMQIWISILSVIWIVGIVALLAYAVISYWKLRRKVGTAVRLQDNIYQSENTTFPFVMGVLRPKVYLPFKMNEQDMNYVIAHECAHIKRRDYWWKPLGFLLMTIYWFNPLMWIAYILFCRDIELACDEKVVNAMEESDKVAYAQALLNCSIPRKMNVSCPLAFGEVSVKQRVKNVLNYRKPAFWIIFSAILISIVVAVCFLTNPKTETDMEGDGTDLPISDTSDEIEVKEAGNFEYRYDEELGGIVITKYTGEDASVVIPKIIDSSSVVRIGDMSFYENTNVTSITIPDSVTSIGDCAFWGCNNLTNITIPDSVMSIGRFAFYECISLTSITIPAGVKSIEGVFQKCSSLTSITIPDSVTSIDGAFIDCISLTNIMLPDSITSIGESAFSGCSSLTDITIPDNVTSIREYAFYGCENLTSINIPNSVTLIGYCTFFECRNLTNITVPDSVIMIGKYAFYGCENLTVTYKGQEYNSANFDNLYSLFADIMYSGEGFEDNLELVDDVARMAYSAFLSGDMSQVEDAELGQSWVDFYLSNSELEYVLLDLDGDGVRELLIQWIDSPEDFNAVFHFSDGESLSPVFHYYDGKLFCWNFDTVEMSSWDYPLQNGIMVHQYDYNGSSSWTGFRYLPDGDKETIFTFFARYESASDDDTAPVPYYEVDGVEVDRITFESELKERIINQRLERSAWTAVP